MVKYVKNFISAGLFVLALLLIAVTSEVDKTYAAEIGFDEEYEDEYLNEDEYDDEYWNEDGYEEEYEDEYDDEYWNEDEYDDEYWNEDGYDDEEYIATWMDASDTDASDTDASDTDAYASLTDLEECLVFLEDDRVKKDSAASDNEDVVNTGDDFSPVIILTLLVSTCIVMRVVGGSKRSEGKNN